MLGPSWGPLGGPFWLKSRLKIAQDDFLTRSDYFFSAPEASRDRLGGPPEAILGPLQLRPMLGGLQEAILGPSGGDFGLVLGLPETQCRLYYSGSWESCF